MHLLDDCVVIPQFEVIRSLNVHVRNTSDSIHEDNYTPYKSKWPRVSFRLGGGGDMLRILFYM